MAQRSCLCSTPGDLQAEHIAPSVKVIHVWFCLALHLSCWDGCALSHPWLHMFGNLTPSIGASI